MSLNKTCVFDSVKFWSTMEFSVMSLQKVLHFCYKERQKIICQITLQSFETNYEPLLADKSNYGSMCKQLLSATPLKSI